jgi:teichuronic acid biosynthesis glycosyltransferase TuaC
VSGDLLKTARNMGAPAERSHAILNGCDTSIFSPACKDQSRKALGLPMGGQMLLYVGRLDVRKGLKELIEATGRLRGQWADLRCFIVGDGPDRPILMKAIELENGKDWIKLIPSCSTKQVALWMAAADLVTLPSYAEGCPNVVLEALASGRPVVATNVGGIPEIMDESVGRLVPPKDVSSLTAALNEVLSQDWNADAIAKRRTRGWSAVADAVEQNLQQIADSFRCNSQRILT